MLDRSLEQVAREVELRNEPWNDIFFLWALIWAMNIPFYKPKMSRFLKDRLRTQDNLLVWAVPAVCPVSRPGKASLWGGEGTLCRGKTSRVEGLKALELLERKGHTYLWNKGKRCCGVLMCNSDPPAYEGITVCSEPSVFVGLGNYAVSQILIHCLWWCLVIFCLVALSDPVAKESCMLNLLLSLPEPNLVTFLFLLDHLKR